LAIVAHHQGSPDLARQYLGDLLPAGPSTAPEMLTYPFLDGQEALRIAFEVELDAGNIDPVFALPENIVTDIFVPCFKQLKHRVLVMRCTGGSMGVYDDCAMVQAAKMIDSTIRFACSIFNEPTQ
jgi:hypothetical protein